MKNWHRKTGIYPISHMVVVKNARLDDSPELASELCRVFEQAKTPYVERLQGGEATAAMDTELLGMGQIVQGDPIPYGLESSRRTLDAFIDFNVSQGVIPERVEPEEIFPAATLA